MGSKVHVHISQCSVLNDNGTPTHFQLYKFDKNIIIENEFWKYVDNTQVYIDVELHKQWKDEKAGVFIRVSYHLLLVSNFCWGLQIYFIDFFTFYVFTMMMIIY